MLKVLVYELKKLYQQVLLDIIKTLVILRLLKMQLIMPMVLIRYVAMIIIYLL